VVTIHKNLPKIIKEIFVAHSSARLVYLSWHISHERRLEYECNLTVSALKIDLSNSARIRPQRVPDGGRVSWLQAVVK
jgi:hypothetical protein